MTSCHALVQLGDKIVDARILATHFACDLAACHGICCFEGESGAPLVPREVEQLEAHCHAIAPHLPPDAQQALAQGVSYRDASGEWVTQLVRGGRCAFAGQQAGCFYCTLTRLREQGKVPVDKPISCALYPIRVEHRGMMTMLRYDQWHICRAALDKGAREGLLLHEFLKEPLLRAFGAAFYAQLCTAARLYQAKGHGC